MGFGTSLLTGMCSDALLEVLEHPRNPSRMPSATATATLATSTTPPPPHQNDSQSREIQVWLPPQQYHCIRLSRFEEYVAGQTTCASTTERATALYGFRTALCFGCSIGCRRVPKCRVSLLHVPLAMARRAHVSTTHVCSRDSARAQRFGMMDPKGEVGYGMLWCESILYSICRLAAHKS